MMNTLYNILSAVTEYVFVSLAAHPEQILTDSGEDDGKGNTPSLPPAATPFPNLFVNYGSQGLVFGDATEGDIALSLRFRLACAPLVELIRQELRYDDQRYTTKTTTRKD